MVEGGRRIGAAGVLHRRGRTGSHGRVGRRGWLRPNQQRWQGHLRSRRCHR